MLMFNDYNVMLSCFVGINEVVLTFCSAYKTVYFWGSHVGLRICMLYIYLSS